MNDTTTRRNERVVWINGELVPESSGNLSFRDAGFVYGDAVFDTARTFNGVPFMLEEHIDRLFKSLRYAGINPGYDKAALIAATHETIEANRHLLGPDEDYWVSQRISSGVPSFEGETPNREGATVVIECMPLPLKARAPMFNGGIDAVVASVRRVPPEALSPNAKTNNYMNMKMAQREVSAIAPGSWAVLLDHNGHISEGAGCNMFIIIDGVVVTPPRETVLPGISRQVAIDLCRETGIPCEERLVSLYDAKTADEAFFTSTSLCICPLRSFNGGLYPKSPGPVTERLIEAFKNRVGMDYIAQYLQHLTDGPADTGI